MRKAMSIIMVCLMLGFGATCANAYWVGSVCDGLGNCVDNVQVFDWSSSGSGAAVGFVPVVGDTFDFYYQARLVGLENSAGDPVTFNNLNNTFEYTVVASIPERVSAIGADGKTTFTTQPGALFYIYNDIPPNTSTATGFGFDDGTLVASGTIMAGQSTIFDPATGLGSTIIEGLVGYTNPAFLAPDMFIFDFRFEGTVNEPPGNAATASFFNGTAGEGNLDTYTVNLAGGDLLFRVDGSSKFSTVPEPSTMLLLGAGLLGLAGFARRRTK